MKFKELKNLSAKEREKKLGELKIELVKSRAGNAKGAKTKQIKKIIARIFTLNKLEEDKSSKEVGKNK